MNSVNPSRVAQIAIVVRDLERAKHFYGELLGVTWLFDAPPGMSFYQCGETRLMLAPPEGLETAGISIVYYEVEDIEAAHRALAGHGVAFEAAPHVVARLGANDLWLAICRDPDGNMVGLMSERPASLEAPQGSAAG
jgi:methylmalonyl-CoA/ethylmalonyl-CoA epimerase